MSESESRRRLADWFRQWHSPLKRFLLGRTAARSADLEDIAQEVFLRLLRYEQAELVEHPQAYLFKVASNVATEWSIRSRYRLPHESEWLAGLAMSDEPLESQAYRDQIQCEIERAIRKLPARQQEILKLQFVDGLSHAEIAKHMGVTQRSVKRFIIKSYQKLRMELSPELIEVLDEGRVSP